MISKYYGKNYSIEYLRERSHITRKGVSLLGLSEAAESIGFQTQGVFLSWEQLRDEVPLPAIAHWKQTHFVVVYKVQKAKRLLSFFKNQNGEEIVIGDPAHGLLKYSKSEFLKNWSSGKDNGIVLLLETKPAFYTHDTGDASSKNIALRNLLHFVRPYHRYIVQLIIGLLTGTIINLIFPFLTESIVDHGINSRDISFVFIVLVAQMVLSLAQTANTLIQNWISLHVTSRVSIKFISGFLSKLMRLPISFFYSRTIGDIMQRIEDQNRVQSFITTTLISSLFSIITLISYTTILWHYDIGILGIFYLGTLLYLGWIFIFLRMRRDLDYKRFQELSNNQNNVVQLITGMQEIRVAGCEQTKRWEWERTQAKLFNVSIKSLILNQNQVLGSSFIDSTKNIIISFLAATAVIDGHMSLGMMIAVQYMIGQLNAPVQQFTSFIQSAQDAKISLERLDTVYNKIDEETPDQNRLYQIPKNSTIYVRNITFQYEGPESEKVLDDLSFEVPPKKTTAIVGLSGSGKTTLLKILLGIYKPTRGEIFLDNTPIEKYSPSIWRKSCGIVMQDGFIFSDTIANNICLNPEDLEHSRLEHAVSSANIKDFIESLPVRYHTKIGSDGHGLSSGQKQRIMIARAIYKNTDFVFFDEATNALDAKNEKNIIDNLNEVFNDKTMIIIAHRLSTIKKAHQILVLDKGKIIEKGTHDELIQLNGSYFNLIENQLSISPV